jgi:hypothetical protein
MSTDTDRLRQELLYDGIIEPVNMSRIDSQLRELFPVASVEEHQRLALEVIESLVGDSLAEPGYLGQEEDEFVVESLADTLTRIRDKYVGHYDDPAQWMWCAWLKLTAKGLAAANSTPHGQHVAAHERERREALRESSE